MKGELVDSSLGSHKNDIDDGFKCGQKSILKTDKDDNNENMKDEVENLKCDCQLEKQTENGDKKDKDEETTDKKRIIFDLLSLFKAKCTLDEDDSDIIPRSPMRTQDYHHYTKPYEYPHSTSSRAIGGITRVVENDFADYDHHSLHSCQRLRAHAQEDGQDVDITDINNWLFLCQNDPHFLPSFINAYKTEINKKEISNPQSYRETRTSICSSSSSQISSPAQSPSEHNVTSPETLTYDDNSFYPKSPNDQPLECTNIRPSEDSEDLDKILSKPPSPKEEEILNELNGLHQLNILPGTDTKIFQPCLGSSPPNIGTVMLHLASGTQESTIDLTQFATVCDTNSSQNFITTEKECLNEKLDPKAKENAWARISQLNVDLLGKGDKEGDTQLMILLVSEKFTREYIYVIVERLLKENANYLSLRNDQNQDALYLAAFKRTEDPIVASYIAEALVRGKQDVNLKYDDGPLLHCLAKKGDNYAKVLERLVQLRNVDNTPIFDLNKKDKQGYTPLHIACEAHKPEGPHTYKIVQILMENGADCTVKEHKDENTPLHTLIMGSCDVELIKILLGNYRYDNKDSPKPTTIRNRQGNTPLHIACSRNTLPLPVQKDIVEILLRHGAMIQIKNINGAVPSVLVENSRKLEIKNILHSYRQK